MKFWQLIQFVDRQALLVDEDFKGKWPWLIRWFEDLRRIAASQEREKLDAQLPQEVVVAALTKSNVVFDFTRGYLRCRAPHLKKGLSAVEAYLRFGAEAMSEAYEYGSYEIVEK